MINPVSALQGATVSPSVSVANPSASSNGFSDLLGKALDSLDQSVQTSNGMSDSLATGQAPSAHTVMIASEEAVLSVQLAVQVRNKVLDAYQQLMSMQM